MSLIRKSTLMSVIVLLTLAMLPMVIAQDESPAEVGIRFAAKVGDQDAVCGQTYENVGASESQIEITDLRFYISNVRLINSAEEEVPLTLAQDDLWQYQNLALLDFEDGSGQCRDTGNEPLNDQLTGSIPAGDYSGIAFDVGIPFELNHLDSTTAPSPLNVGAMWWYWQDGYKFVRVDLLLNEDIWIFHLGSTGCTASDFSIAPSKPCRNPNVAPIRLDDFNFETDVIVADVSTLLATLDMVQSTEPGCMSENGDADCRSAFPAFGLTQNTQDCSGDACAAQRFFRVQAASE
jgi:uncharacterized repeat protein (TIGR04052 family)